MFRLSSLRPISLLSLLAAMIFLPAGVVAEVPVPGAFERHIEQSETPEPSGELLDADELERLQARDEEPGPEVVGGALSNKHLTYIVIALGAALLVLVAK